jgi:hypothetical protein
MLMMVVKMGQYAFLYGGFSESLDPLCGQLPILGTETKKDLETWNEQSKDIVSTPSLAFIANLTSREANDPQRGLILHSKTAFQWKSEQGKKKASPGLVPGHSSGLWS